MSVGIRPRVVIQTERTIYVYVYFLRMRYRSLMEDGTGVWKVGACEIKKKKKKIEKYPKRVLGVSVTDRDSKITSGGRVRMRRNENNNSRRMPAGLRCQKDRRRKGRWWR